MLIRRLRGVMGWLARGRVLAVAVGLGLGAVMSLPSASRAQDAGEQTEAEMEMGGFSSSMRKSHVEAMARAAGLSEEQQKTVMDLFATFRGQVTDASKKLMEFQKGLGGGMGMPTKENMKKMTEAMSNYSEHVNALESRFMEDFKATLTAEQVKSWPKIERKKRLNDASAMGMMGGGVTNLAEMAQRISGEAPAELVALVDEYEGELDTASTDLLEFRRKMEKDIKELGEKMAEMSMEEQQKFGMRMMQDMQKKSQAVQEVNERWLSRFAGVLPEGKRGGFQLEFYRSGWMQFLAREDPAYTKAFDAAQKLEGLTESQSKGLADARAAWENDLVNLYKGVNAKRAEEMKAAGDDAVAAFGGGQSTREFFEKYPEINKAAVTKVRGALTPELLAKLPSPFKPAEVKEPTFEE